MLFGCRKGQYVPSRKTLLKLESAEREAGIAGGAALQAAVAGGEEMAGDYFAGLSAESRKIAEAITAALGEEMRAMEERLRATLMDWLEKESGKGKRGK
jgi:hypothetical protein